MLTQDRDRFFLFSYFLFLIVAGSALLYLPAAWRGPTRLRYVDALFTSTSAVCVTGLTSVDTSLYSPFGHLVIMLLIQFGGLGIITFMTLYFVARRGKMSLVNRKLIGDYFLESVGHNPSSIMRKVLAFTAAIELAGSLILYTVFRRTVPERPYFTALFHAVSAFCNAGFSVFSTNLEDYVANPTVNLCVAALIVLGGLGFVVHEDLLERLLGRTRRLSVHTRLVLGVSGALILLGLVAFLALEWDTAFRGLRPLVKIQAALFASVTPRTAGFDTVLPSEFSLPSRFMTMILMYVGASPASTGGGIKTTTFFIVLIMVIRGGAAREDIRVFRRKVSPASVSRAMVYALRALAVVAAATLALTVTEVFARGGSDPLFVQVVYEVLSAFGTVGLTLGLTPRLSDVGKMVIVLTMIVGRVGMAAVAMSASRRLPRRVVDVPEEEVLVG